MSIYSKMTAIADAIREKTGGTNPLTLDAMAEAIAGIEAGGDTQAEDAILAGTLTEYYNDRITTVRENAFSNCYQMTKVDLPNVTKIGGTSFQWCTTLTSVNLPKLRVWSGSGRLRT